LKFFLSLSDKGSNVYADSSGGGGGGDNNSNGGGGANTGQGAGTG